MKKGANKVATNSKKPRKKASKKSVAPVLEADGSVANPTEVNDALTRAMKPRGGSDTSTPMESFS